MSFVFILIGFGFFLLVIGVVITILLTNKNSNKVICPECNKEIDANVSQCPYCGFSIPRL